jgi:hypothetical protein
VNNTIANAWSLSGTGMLGSRFESTTDGDWYKISATSGRYYSVETIVLDTGVNTKIEVYAPTSALYKPAYP